MKRQFPGGNVTTFGTKERQVRQKKRTKKSAISNTAHTNTYSMEWRRLCLEAEGKKHDTCIVEVETYCREFVETRRPNETI